MSYYKQGCSSGRAAVDSHLVGLNLSEPPIPSLLIFAGVFAGLFFWVKSGGL